MTHPLLYRIGLENQCFGVPQFFKWIFYALLHSAMIYFVCLEFICQPSQHLDNGKDVGFWVSGHVVYGTCIVVANIVMVHQFNNFTGWGEALAFGMCLNYFTCFFAQSFFNMFPQLFYIFNTTFQQISVWVAIVFCCLTVSAFELLINRRKLLRSKPQFQPINFQGARAA